MALRLRDVRPDRDDLALLQTVLEGAPTYTARVTGLPVGPADAQSLYAGAPEGFDRDDKHVWLVEEDGTAVGCVDVLAGYPSRDVAWIGLLLLREQDQGRGLGAGVWALVEETVSGWPRIEEIRLAVVRTNEAVLPFWRARGFAPTGVVHPYRYGGLESESVVMGKDVSRPRPGP